MSATLPKSHLVRNEPSSFVAKSPGAVPIYNVAAVRREVGSVILDCFHAGNSARRDKAGLALAFTRHETPKVHDPFAHGDVIHH